MLFRQEKRKGKNQPQRFHSEWTRDWRFLKYWLLLLVPHFLVNGCVIEKTPIAPIAIKVYYLFDISGSYRENLNNGSTPLHESVKRAHQILKHLSELQDPTNFPQTHQIGFISERILHGKPATRIDQVGIFDKPGQDLETFAKELDNVLTTQSSGATDIYGGLYKAVQALKESNAKNKLIILFSDLHNATQNPSNYEVDMTGIKLIGYYIETGKAKTNPGILQDDIRKFEEILRKTNCSRWHLIHLDAFDTSQINEMLKNDN